MSNQKQDMPVYLFTGFLDSGKTKFIQETLEDKRFCNGEKTLLLICEEGEEEYEPQSFCDDSVKLRVLSDKTELNAENLAAMARDTEAERVVIEYNGMWLLDELYSAMPEKWMVYQEFMFAEAGTFLAYNANMRQLVYDKLKSCELVVFNRFSDSIDRMELHKIVRGASRRTDIAYEYADGKVVYDDIEDPLPFDLNAPVVEIGDDDFAEWYRDLSEEPDKYEGKTVRFRCKAIVRKKLPKESIVVGRHVMTCCVEDIQFAGLVCQLQGRDFPTDNSWNMLTATLNFKFNIAYGRKGPVLTCTAIEPASAPEQEVATFY